MARIKLKLGDIEIEVDSRDFYVDNNTLPETIENVSHLLQENQAKIYYENNNQETESSNQIAQPTQNGLEYLKDAEAFEHHAQQQADRADD